MTQHLLSVNYCQISAAATHQLIGVFDNLAGTFHATQEVAWRTGQCIQNSAAGM
jgi:hypothetical protein